MPRYSDRLILAKAESTYNTAPTMAGSDAVRVMNDLQLDPLQMELITRDILYPHVSQRPRMVTQRLGAISFGFELTGSGTAGTAPKIGLFFRAAGYSETIVASTSVTYAPIGTGYESLCLDVHHGGKRHRLTGVRGDIEVELKTNGIPMGKFTGLGIYAVPTDVSNPSQTFAAQADPVVVNADNTTPISVYSYSACMESFTLKSGRSPKLHQRAGCTKQIRIDDERAPEGEILIESPTIADKNYFADASAQTGGTISWTHGTVAGNIISHTSSNCSLGDPAYEDGDGVEMLKLPFIPIPTATNGYNDHTFVFT
jgi:hypothetical protein